MHLRAEMDFSWPPKNVKDPAKMLAPVQYRKGVTPPSLGVKEV